MAHMERMAAVPDALESPGSAKISLIQDQEALGSTTLVDMTVVRSLKGQGIVPKTWNAPTSAPGLRARRNRASKAYMS